MSDISKCENTRCPLSKSCWRFNAPSNELWQAYQDFTFTTDKKTGEIKCEDYWEMKEITNKEK